MARAELYLEDNEHGVSLVIRHLGGFSKESQAHLMANQLIKYLDDHADWKKEEIQEMVDPASPIITDHRPGVIHL